MIDLSSVWLWIKAHQEVLPLTINIVMFLGAFFAGERGKAVYWLGAAILTIGILMMRG